MRDEPRSANGSGAGLPINEPDRDDFVRQADELVEDPLLVGVADEGAREALVDRGGEHEHHQRAGVDVPVRHGPRDLDAPGLLELVRLVVPRVVARLVRGDDEVHRRLRDERVTVLGFLERLGDRTALRLVGDDDDAAALAETARGRAANDADDALDLLTRQRLGVERAVHAPLGEDLAELHGRTV